MKNNPKMNGAHFQSSRSYVLLEVASIITITQLHCVETENKTTNAEGSLHKAAKRSAMSDYMVLESSGHADFHTIFPLYTHTLQGRVI